MFALAAGAMIMFEPYRLQRMTTFLDPRADASGAGWQIVQATLGLGNGGLTGVGLGNGTVKSFTPEASTDMIASVIGEELGLLGIVALVGVMLNVANSESGAAAKARPRRKSTDAKPKQQQQPAVAKPRPD